MPQFSDMFENIGADEIGSNESRLIIPGRADLRISLTASCNLQCSHCHNEGQEAPWLNKNSNRVTVTSIEELIVLGVKYGAKSIKFTGGDPGVFHDFYGLMAALAEWHVRFPSVSKWTMSTNGTPFLNPKKFKALVESKLTHISIGVDSVEPGEYSKPSSPIGVEGRVLVERFIAPLSQAWKDRVIKVDTVFTGDYQRVLNVIQITRWWELKRLRYGIATHYHDLARMDLQDKSEQFNFDPGAASAPCLPSGHPLKCVRC